MITNKRIVNFLSIQDIKLRMPEFHSFQEILVNHPFIIKTKLKMLKYQKIQKIVEEVHSIPTIKLKQ